MSVSQAAGNCADKGVYVEIDGTEIPTTNVETYVSKDGPPFMTRLSSVEFPFEWKDVDITSAINGYNTDNAAPYQTCTIYYSDEGGMGGERGRSGGRYIAHHGFIGSVGGTDRVGVGKFWVYDPHEFMGGLPASVTFERATVQEVLDYICYDEDAGITPNSPFTVSYNPGEFTGTTATSENGSGGGSLTYGAGVALQTKTFERNKHTILDVINWVAETTGAKWYFENLAGGAGVMLVLDSSVDGEEYVQHGFDEGGYGVNSFSIIKNTAISEIQPYNTIKVFGETGMALTGWLPFMPPSDQFPYAKAVYPPLVQRAGGEHMPEIQNSEVKNPKAAEAKAKKKLKEQVSNAGEGNIEGLCKPQILPSDNIIARPTCSQHFSMDVPALNWEVQEVQHQKESGKRGRTKVYASLYIDGSLIEVESGMLEV